MIVIRPITNNDTEAFINFAFTAGIGMTSMPKNREVLQKRVADSEKSFSKEVQETGDEEYLFVMEDLKTRTIGGTCGINAKTGISLPKYFYHVEVKEKYSPHLSMPQQIPQMSPVSYRNAPSEICSLYIMPEFRREGLGRLLSLSRFLFIAAHPHRFDNTVYAEMRGFTDKNQNCPFWEGIGRHFLDIDYDELMRLRDMGNFDVSQVLPEYPIYNSLLPKEVQEVIGKIHSNTWPAFNMLTQEGFYLTDDIDVFDGGPKIEAETQEIRTIKTCSVDTVVEITRNPIESSKYILSNNRLDFRSCYSTLLKESKGVSISSETAEALQVNVGDKVRYVIPSIEITQQKPHQTKESAS